MERRKPPGYGNRLRRGLQAKSRTGAFWTGIQIADYLRHQEKAACVCGGRNGMELECPFHTFILGTILMTGLSERPKSMNADDEILAREAELQRAQLASDVDALNRILDDCLMFTSFDGTLVTK